MRYRIYETLHLAITNIVTAVSVKVHFLLFLPFWFRIKDRVNPREQILGLMIYESPCSIQSTAWIFCRLAIDPNTYSENST